MEFIKFMQKLHDLGISLIRKRKRVYEIDWGMGEKKLIYQDGTKLRWQGSKNTVNLDPLPELIRKAIDYDYTSKFMKRKEKLTYHVNMHNLDDETLRKLMIILQARIVNISECVDELLSVYHLVQNKLMSAGEITTGAKKQPAIKETSSDQSEERKYTDKNHVNESLINPNLFLKNEYIQKEISPK